MFYPTHFPLVDSSLGGGWGKFKYCPQKSLISNGNVIELLGSKAEEV